MDDGLTALKGSAMEALEELILKLEAAAGPDRTLDFEISIVKDGGDPRDYEINGAFIDCLPRYTASIDAALTLIPARHEWHELQRNVQWDDPNIFSGQEREYGVQFYGMTEAGYPDVQRSYIGAHDLLPIALCIASLRARLAEHLKAPTRRPLAQEPNPMTPKPEGEM